MHKCHSPLVGNLSGLSQAENQRSFLTQHCKNSRKHCLQQQPKGKRSSPCNSVPHVITVNGLCCRPPSSLGPVRPGTPVCAVTSPMLTAALSSGSPQRPLVSHECPEQWLKLLAQLGDCGPGGWAVTRATCDLSRQLAKQC